MHALVIDDQTLWPLAIYFAATVVIIAGLIGLSFILGQRHRERATGGEVGIHAGVDIGRRRAE